MNELSPHDDIPTPRRPEDRDPLPLPRVLLVRGCPRSGTTMLAEMLNASREAAIMFEYALGDLAMNIEPILAYGVAYARDHEVSAEVARVAAEDGGAYVSTARTKRMARYPRESRRAAIVASIVTASLDRPGASIIGSKTPGTSAWRDRAILAPLFPSISYLFAVRSPLAVINSAMNRRNLARLGVDIWPQRDVGDAVRVYRENVAFLLSHAARYPASTYVLKYEDAAADVAGAISRLETWFGVTADRSETSPFHEKGYMRWMTRATRSVLTGEEDAQARRAFGSAIDRWPQKELTGVGLDLNEALADCADVLAADTLYRFADPQQRPFLGLGWSSVQPDGVWSEGERADLIFTPERDGEYLVRIDASMFLPAAAPSVTIGIELDGAPQFHQRFAGIDGPQSIRFGPVTLSAGRAHVLSVHVADPRSPLRTGVSADQREVGLLLHTVTMTGA